jgi:predicted MPP superfamily phosphohydrolase
VDRLARIIFPYYWNTLSLAGAVGEWILFCWAFAAPATVFEHVVALAGLFSVNRIAAAAFEYEDASAPLRHRGGALVLAGGFAAAGGAVGLFASALAWACVVRAGGLTAQAGTLGTMAHAWLGPEFEVVGWLGVLGGAGLVVDGYVRGYRRLGVTRLQITLPHLAPALDGFRLVHVSDLHLGPIAHRGALREALERVVDEAPDLVVVTGDIIDSAKSDLDLWLPELRRLRARHGVVAILGNHDSVAGLDRIADGIRRVAGWSVLRDETTRIDVTGAALVLIGLEYRPTPHDGDAVAALVAKLPPATAAVLLAHHPNAFAAATDAGIALTLAGHTHGGPVALPLAPRWNPARWLMTPYDAGTFVERGCTLHVNRGLGTSGQRVRIAAPREITVITLRAPDARPLGDVPVFG